MQVEVVLKRMQTNFGGCGIFGFGDFAPFHWPSKTVKFPFRTMDYSPGADPGFATRGGCPNLGGSGACPPEKF